MTSKNVSMSIGEVWKKLFILLTALCVVGVSIGFFYESKSSVCLDGWGASGVGVKV